MIKKSNYHFNIALVSKDDRFFNIKSLVKGLFENYGATINCELIKLENINIYKSYFDKMDAVIYLDDYICELTNMYGKNVLYAINNKNIIIEKVDFDYSIESIYEVINDVFRYSTDLYDFISKENKELSKIVESYMTTSKRFNHILAVNKLSKEIVTKNNIECDLDKLEKICLLHDITKEQDIELDSNTPRAIWHAVTGATFAFERLNINDEVILDAIKYHTTGRDCMNIYDEVLSLSDFCEPFKKGNKRDNVREFIFSNIKKALGIKFKIQYDEFLEKSQQDTIDAYESYKRYL